MNYVPMKSVYVFQNDIGDIKIGVSENVEFRRKNIQSISGYKIKREFHTAPCSNAFEIETRLHNFFATKKKSGEWFHIPFETAVEIASKFFKEMAEFKPKQQLDGKEIFYNLDNIFNQEANDADDIMTLVEQVVEVMERQNSPAVKVAMQTEMLLKHFGIPVIEDFVESSPFEQLTLDAERT